MAKARECFVVGMVVDIKIYSAIELEFFEELMGEKSWQKTDRSGKVIGVLRPCPTCRSNKFVTTEGPRRIMRTRTHTHTRTLAHMTQ